MTEPTEPPPLVRTNAPPSDEDAEAEVAAEREWEMLEIRDKTKVLKASFSNRMFVDPDGKHLRISFGERVGDEDVYHSAVVVPLEEAYELGELLIRMGDAGLRAMWERQRQFLADNPSVLSPQDQPNG